MRRCVVQVCSTFAAMGVAITMAGFSESRAMVDVMLLLLHCTGHVMKADPCKNAAELQVPYNTSFLATCRNGLPVSRHKCAGNNAVAWAWESFAGVDMRLESLLSGATNRTEPRRVLVYSVGAHYFAQFPGHQGDHYHNHGTAEVELKYPRAWMSQYYRDMEHLMSWLSSWRERNICVIWKTNNIGWAPLPTGHPSQSHGAHHYLNHWNIAMAEAAGLHVFDVEPLTLTYSKRHWNHSRPKHDFYHSYDFIAMSQALISFIRTNC